MSLSLFTPFALVQLLVAPLTPLGAVAPHTSPAPPLAPGASTETAVVDRFEGETAVLVLDRGGTVHRPRSALPPAGRSVDAVFRAHLLFGRVVALEYDPDATRERRRTARERFDRLTRERDDYPPRRATASRGPPPRHRPGESPRESTRGRAC
ncbi:DUF3006 domain-containing protein [Halomarina ordinaria]|uniref:DUF3006 domain-containing protein n=1 Tax=Halomarina ordinaria TaxID=3033939 RepID=A0ABD5U4J8_9EURY|nr:DUF3006 domain-containing protein [Halomarina sp. PSRA2]